MYHNNIEVGVSGKFKLTVSNPTTGEERELPWFDNLILNNGLDKIGSGDSALVTYCCVGSDSTPPDVNQVGVLSIVGSGIAVKADEDVAGVSAVAPYYGYQRRKFVFPANSVVGNLTEISVGWAANNTSAFSRTLIKDGNTPVTLTILADEILTVVYELRIYMETSVVGNLPLPIGEVVHDVTIVPSYGNDHTYWGGKIGSETLLSGMSNNSVKYYDGFLNNPFSYPTGNTISPLGTCPPMVTLPYTNGNYYRDFTYNCNAGSCNLVEGIRSLMWRLGGTFGAFQFEFDPPIAKTSESTFTFTLRYLWNRHTL